MIQQLMVMGGAPGPDGTSGAQSTSKSKTGEPEKEADASGLTAILTQLLANPDSQQLQQLTGLLSPSQQAQLQELIKQVKDRQQPNAVCNCITTDVFINIFTIYFSQTINKVAVIPKQCHLYFNHKMLTAFRFCIQIIRMYVLLPEF